MTEHTLPKSWTIKRMANGMKLFIFTIASLLAVHAHILYLADYSWDNYNRLFVPVLISYPVVAIAWLTVVPAAILKKRVPKTILIDGKKSLIITYPKSKQIVLDHSEYSFTYHRYSLHSVLVIHQSIFARRGHIVKRERLILTGLGFGKGWNMKRLDEIAEYLTKIGIEFIKTEDKPFLSRLLE